MKVLIVIIQICLIIENIRRFPLLEAYHSTISNYHHNHQNRHFLDYLSVIFSNMFDAISHRHLLHLIQKLCDLLVLFEESPILSLNSQFR